MNGECKSYRLNEPMKWAEFKVMPDDLKVVYIKAIREKYNAPVAAIAGMMGVDRAQLSRHLAGLGFKGLLKGKYQWDKMAFAEWCYGAPLEASEEEPAAEEVQQPAWAVEEAPVVEDDLPWNELEEEEEAPAAEPVTLTSLMAVPESGSMTFTGDATRIMNTLVNLFGGAKIKINVHWDVMED